MNAKPKRRSNTGILGKIWQPAVIVAVLVVVAYGVHTAAVEATADAFKKTLLNAKSVSYTDPAGGGTARFAASSVTSAPRLRASAASATPIRPDDRLPT